MSDNLDGISAACRAIEEEQEERRLDNESWAARVKELETEIASLKAAKTRLVCCMEGGILQTINATGPTDQIEVFVIDADAKDNDAELGEENVYEHPDGGIVWVYRHTRFDMIPESEQEWLDRMESEDA
jgi:hypothetical protein